MTDDVPTDPQVLADAGEAFRAGVERRAAPEDARDYFRTAADKFELLRRRGVDGTAINKNLGNSYLLFGDVPQAILAYRRALRFAGSDRHIQEALAFARSQVAYPAGGDYGRPPVDQRPPWLPRLSRCWYGTFGLIFYSFTQLALAFWWSGRPGRWGLWTLMSCIAFAIIVAALAAEESRDADFTNRPVVVISDDGVLLRSGNGLSYPPRSEIPLNRGVEARLLFVRGDWLQIELSGGEIGWVPREYALVDDPGSG
jgi:hypothetical protein